jgi:uncharacterized protein (DUF2147 family)
MQACRARTGYPTGFNPQNQRGSLGSMVDTSRAGSQASRWVRALLLLGIGLLFGVPAHAANPNAVIGTWWTQDHDGVIRIQACPSGLCGQVVGITTFRPDGSAPLDVNGQSRCQLQIIPDGRPGDSGTWDSHITDPDDGKTYTTELRVGADGRLQMRGYIGIPLLGRTVYWTPFHGHLTPDCHIQP